LSSRNENARSRSGKYVPHFIDDVGRRAETHATAPDAGGSTESAGVRTSARTQDRPPLPAHDVQRCGVLLHGQKIDCRKGKRVQVERLARGFIFTPETSESPPLGGRTAVPAMSQQIGRMRLHSRSRAASPLPRASRPGRRSRARRPGTGSGEPHHARSPPRAACRARRGHSGRKRALDCPIGQSDDIPGTRVDLSQDRRLIEIVNVCVEQGDMQRRRAFDEVRARYAGRWAPRACACDWPGREDAPEARWGCRPGPRANESVNPGRRWDWAPSRKGVSSPRAWRGIREAIARNSDARLQTG